MSVLDPMRARALVARLESPPAATCDECGQTMAYDGGEPMTRQHPGDAPCWFCPDCGLTKDADQGPSTTPGGA